MLSAYHTVRYHAPHEHWGMIVCRSPPALRRLVKKLYNLLGQWH